MIIRTEMYKFQARLGRLALTHLRDHASLMVRTRGCLEALVARSPDDSDQYLVYSRWDSRESHGAMALQLRRNQEAQKPLLALLPMLEGEPRVSHYEALEG